MISEMCCCCRWGVLECGIQDYQNQTWPLWTRLYTKTVYADQHGRIWALLSAFPSSISKWTSYAFCLSNPLSPHPAMTRRSLNKKHPQKLHEHKLFVKQISPKEEWEQHKKRRDREKQLFRHIPSCRLVGCTHTSLFNHSNRSKRQNNHKVQKLPRYLTFQKGKQNEEKLAAEISFIRMLRIVKIYSTHLKTIPSVWNREGAVLLQNIEDGSSDRLRLLRRCFELDGFQFWLSFICEEPDRRRQHICFRPPFAPQFSGELRKSNS